MLKNNGVKREMLQHVSHTARHAVLNLNTIQYTADEMPDMIAYLG